MIDWSVHANRCSNTIPTQQKQIKRTMQMLMCSDSCDIRDCQRMVRPCLKKITGGALKALLNCDVSSAKTGSAHVWNEHLCCRG
jgi:hypothetical protein